MNNTKSVAHNKLLSIKKTCLIHDVHRDKENSEKSKSCSNRSFSLLVYYWKFYVKI